MNREIEHVYPSWDATEFTNPSDDRCHLHKDVDITFTAHDA